MILVNEDTKAPVKKGDKVTSFRGAKAIVESWEEPRHAGSTGRVYVRESKAGFVAGYFPGVFGLEFVKEPV